MTARTRSRLRRASLVTLASLAALALSMLAVHGLFAIARADGAAAVHDPTVDPGAYGEDVFSMYRAGAWGGFAVAMLAGALPVLRRIAQRRSIAWLDTYAKPIAGAVAVVATVLTFLAREHWIDPNVVIAAVGAVGMILGRLPGDAPKPSSATTAAPPQAGHVALGVLLALAGAAALLLAACPRPSGSTPGLRHELVDCGRSSVADLATDLAPAVATILTGDTPSWRAQLDALLSAGTQAGACAVRAVTADLERRAQQAITGAHAAGQDAIGAAHGREYLAARGFAFGAP